MSKQPQGVSSSRVRGYVQDVFRLVGHTGKTRKMTVYNFSPKRHRQSPTARKNSGRTSRPVVSMHSPKGQRILHSRVSKLRTPQNNTVTEVPKEAENCELMEGVSPLGLDSSDTGTSEVIGEVAPSTPEEDTAREEGQLPGKEVITNELTLAVDSYPACEAEDVSALRSSIATFSQLAISELTAHGLRWAVVTRKEAYVTNCGPMHNPRLLLSERGLFQWQVFFTTICSGSWSTSNMLEVQTLLGQLEPSSGYIICPGIDIEPFEGLIPYIKHLRSWGRPFYRRDSDECAMFHAPLGQSQMCPSCSTLKKRMHQQLQRNTHLSPSNKENRTSTSSKYKISYLSPASQKRRHASTMRERKAMMKSLSNYRSHDVVLEASQHTEMTEVVNYIAKEHQNDLEQVLQMVSNNNEGTGALFRSAWDRDVAQKQSKARTCSLLKDQKKNGTRVCMHTLRIVMVHCCFASLVTGSKGNRWSMMTYRLGESILLRQF